MRWKNIPNFEGLYQASNTGLIRSKHYSKIKLLKPSFHTGYYTCVLRKDKKLYCFKVHRLIALTWIPNPFNYPIVKHKDNNKLNCHKNNLAWDTYSNNTKEYYKSNGGRKKSFLTRENILFIRQSDLSVSKLTTLFNIDGSYVSKIKNKQRCVKVC